jgi:hypothetical protein
MHLYQGQNSTGHARRHERGAPINAIKIPYLSEMSLPGTLVSDASYYRLDVIHEEDPTSNIYQK